MTHWFLIIGAAVLIFSGYASLFKSFSLQLQLQHDINSNLPTSQKFEPLFWTFSTWKKLKRLEAEYLPGSERFKKITLFSVAGMLQVLVGLMIGAQVLIH